MRSNIFEAFDTAKGLKADLIRIENKVSFTDFQALVPKIHRNSFYLYSLIQDLDLDCSLSQEDVEWFEEIFFPTLRPWLKTIEHLCDGFVENDYQPEIDSSRATNILQPLETVIHALSQAVRRVGVTYKNIKGVLMNTLNLITSEADKELLKVVFNSAIKVMQDWIEQN